ncbi:epoxide hydrolase family protein [Paraburkholderia sp. 22099]|jgi:pimeloyl-ACP methyl ester carboxylesterase|uniref:Pimeloyl-ACP methyl ester carboxylesterase n=1 Tax=Paraburkholderia terricola TaxID=169427 RepID=A0A1M6NYX6_9BURK|nr:MULTISPECIES: epoxide hydrolase [Paraburkholderia]MDR6445131.1 pimeloyl-ACP methyl ester carboxylesterase [Paraburkholderia terricola]SDO21162.1 Pimeloyl-ACP methyl ester carboxylesterase [Paraburkholderia sediminicola]SHK00893.1 Pimeloyl-ACP methyl ester carboxylesterase [Paraburkholderia terricola]
MSSTPFSPTRRHVLAASVAVGAMGLIPGSLFAATGDSTIRPFKVNVPEADLVDLRRRIAATRWPGKETVNDESQGVRLARMQALAKYWGTDYDWRKGEAKLNALPMFMTQIDGLDVQFIHVRSRHEHALPLIMTHGWPGSIFELIKVIAPLTDPTAYGGSADDAFHIVVPSLPGFGFTEQPKTTGWDSNHIARAWGELMARLGYTRFVSQGGDCGSVISHRMAMQKVKGLIGIHVNMPATVPPDIATLLALGEPAPRNLSPKEKAAYDSLNVFYRDNCGYSAMMVTRPQTVGYALADSPVGQAAWMYDKISQWTYSGGVPERSLTRDEILDDISLYWLTDSATSAAQIYWEDHSNNFNAVDISMPAAVTIFPGEIYQAPRSWTERAYHNLIYFNEVNKGGHFAAWEEPQLFATEVRAAFRTLR